MTPKSEERERRVLLRVMAPLAGRERWDLEVPVTGEVSLPDLFERLDPILGRELKKNVLERDDSAYGIVIDQVKIRKEMIDRVKLNGGEEVTVFALLVGGLAAGGDVGDLCS